MGTQEAERLVWKRVAYAGRYGRAGLLEALRLPSDAMDSYLEALAEIVREENRPAFTDH